MTLYFCRLGASTGIAFQSQKGANFSLIQQSSKWWVRCPFDLIASYHHSRRFLRGPYVRTQSVRAPQIMRHEIELFSRKLKVRDLRRGCTTIEWVYEGGLINSKGCKQRKWALYLQHCIFVSATIAVIFICEIRALGSVR